MHPDKKTEELEQIAQLEIEKKLDEQELEMEIIEESEVVEAEVAEELKPLEMKTDEEMNDIMQKKKRNEAIFEMALFLILGILLGITIKTEAIKRITIGFNDYQVIPAKNSYDIGAIKKNLEAEAQAQQAAAEAQIQAQQQPSQK